MKTRLSFDFFDHKFKQFDHKISFPCTEKNFFDFFSFLKFELAMQYNNTKVVQILYIPNLRNYLLKACLFLKKEKFSLTKILFVISPSEDRSNSLIALFLNNFKLEFK